ncbi:cytochrome P450 [Massariosphaeria phaeospora]|uniref:Cytochrome P450 n=1 Tax=Massariosphaeria phaeospora TaxID=100035 RepID=A0A7C8MV69_9PLEO|nr:cytochrome P450 [Massariosphaeria phaeospora]
MLLAALFLSIALYALWSLVTLELNYRRAQSMGIPLIRLPVDPLNALWQVSEEHFWAFANFLHLPVHSWKRVLRRGWQFEAKADLFFEYGPAFALVSPRSIIVQICDAEAVREVLERRRDFVRPSETYELVAVYGPNIMTASPADWARHRKVLATPFSNERIMKLVWDESARQTRQMMADWSVRGMLSSIGKDTRTVSLNVLATVGFGRSFDFKPYNEVEKTDTKDSYRDSLQVVLDNILLILLVPRKYLRYSLLPEWLQSIGRAGDEFQKHMATMLDEEMTAMNQGEKGSGGLMASLVRALDVNQKDKTKGMSVEEVYGNTFVINFAGHDTTANTLTFALVMLMAHPEVQDWVGEEIARVTEGVGEVWDYGHVFQQLIRCKAVLLETLRLYPPVMSLPKRTNEHPQQIPLGDKIITIPPHTEISNNTLAVHTYARYWSDPLAWKPSRWVVSSAAGESVYTPERDTYFPWSDGPQNCPGMKFSQVEFVAVLAMLLRDHRLKVEANDGESPEEVLERTWRVANDCNAHIILQMNNPSQLRVRFEDITLK